MQVLTIVVDLCGMPNFLAPLPRYAKDSASLQYQEESGPNRTTVAVEGLLKREPFTFADIIGTVSLNFGSSQVYHLPKVAQSSIDEEDIFYVVVDPGKKMPDGMTFNRRVRTPGLGSKIFKKI